jgi:hypothetical protein
MSEFQEFESERNVPVFRKWAYKLFVYMFWINIALGFMTARVDSHPYAILTAYILAQVLLIVGILLTIVSIKNKEEKNYQYHISIWGYGIFLILTLISIFSEVEIL